MLPQVGFLERQRNWVAQHTPGFFYGFILRERILGASVMATSFSTSVQGYHCTFFAGYDCSLPPPAGLKNDASCPLCERFVTPDLKKVLPLVLKIVPHPIYWEGTPLPTSKRYLFHLKKVHEAEEAFLKAAELNPSLDFVVVAQVMNGY